MTDRLGRLLLVTLEAARRWVGEPITYVQRQLGHCPPAFTLSVYTHSVPRCDRRAVDLLDDATGRNLVATALDRTEVASAQSRVVVPQTGSITWIDRPRSVVLPSPN